MAFVLRNKHFLKLDDYTSQEIDFLLQLAAELKAEIRWNRDTVPERETPCSHL